MRFIEWQDESFRTEIYKLYLEGFEYCDTFDTVWLGRILIPKTKFAVELCHYAGNNVPSLLLILSKQEEHDRGNEYGDYFSLMAINFDDPNGPKVVKDQIDEIFKDPQRLYNKYHRLEMEG